MKIELTVIERIMLSQLLPKEGNFTNLKLLRAVKEELSFNEDENKKLDFRLVGDKTVWNDVNILREFNFGNVISGIISTELEKLNNEEKLLEEHLTLYEKLIN